MNRVIEELRVMLEGRNESGPQPTKDVTGYLLGKNAYIVAPTLSFVIGFPFLVFSLLCIIQYCNKIRRKKAETARINQYSQRYSMSTGSYAAITNPLMIGKFHSNYTLATETHSPDDQLSLEKHKRRPSLGYTIISRQLNPVRSHSPSPTHQPNGQNHSKVQRLRSGSVQIPTTSSTSFLTVTFDRPQDPAQKEEICSSLAKDIV